MPGVPPLDEPPTVLPIPSVRFWSRVIQFPFGAVRMIRTWFRFGW